MKAIIVRKEYYDLYSIKEKYPKLNYYSSFAEAEEKFTKDKYGYIEFNFQCIDDILALLDFIDAPIVINKGIPIGVISATDIDKDLSKNSETYFITICDNYVE